MGELGRTLLYIGAGSWIVLLAVILLPIRRFHRFSAEWLIAAPRHRVWTIFDIDINNPESRAFHSYLVSINETGGNPPIFTVVCDLEGRAKTRMTTIRYEIVAKRLHELVQTRLIEIDGRPFPYGQRNLDTTELRSIPAGTRLNYTWEGEVQTLGQLLLLKYRYRHYFNRLKASCEGKVIVPVIPRRKPFIALAVSLLAIASFGIALGWAFGLMLSLALVVHEFGHWLAMRLTGQPAPRVMLLPFLGGVTIANHPHKTYFNDAFCALMGAGFSAIPMLGLLTVVLELYPTTTPLPQDLGGAKILALELLVSGSVNLFQLLPFLPLDGGQVLRAVMQSFSTRWTKYALFVIGGTGVAAFLYYGQLLMAGFVGIGILQTWHLPARDGATRPMGAVGLVAVSGAFLMTAGIHAMAAIYGAALLRELN